MSETIYLYLPAAAFSGLLPSFSSLFAVTDLLEKSITESVKAKRAFLRGQDSAPESCLQSQFLHQRGESENPAGLELADGFRAAATASIALESELDL
jgi:hypothetical protein